MTRRPHPATARDAQQPDHGGSSEHSFGPQRQSPERGGVAPAQPCKLQPPASPRHPAPPRRGTSGAAPDKSVQRDATATRGRRSCTTPRSPNHDRHTSEHPDRLLTVEEVARWLGKPKATLYVWRTRGRGPRGIKVGNALRYRRRDVETWLDQHTDNR